MKSRFTISLALLCGLTLAPAFGQWSSDPSKNLPLADKIGDDQVQPKIKALKGNGWWVSWFDADPNTPPPVGYDPHLQKLNVSGVEQFSHNGVLIADLGNSSTQDWGLDADSLDHALLTFLDTRAGSNQQITAVKYGVINGLLWGPRGVLLTHDQSFHAAPKIAGTDDGNVVVAWTSDSDVVLQKLDPNGQPSWGAGVVLSEAGYNYSVADLHATLSDSGSVIISYVRDKGFGSNRELHANKLSSTGDLLWGPSGITLFDNGSLQFGNWPNFVTDGNGGAVFAWYESSPTLQVFAQRIREDGSEAFQHNGVAVSLATPNIRVSPSVSFRKDTGETFVFWTEEDSLQSKNGVSGQKLGPAGTRLWGNNGLTIVPLGSDSQIFVTSVPIGGGALVFWVDQASFTSSTIYATRLNGQGATVCPKFPVSTAAVAPFGLVADIAPNSTAALAWSDSRIGNNGIYIQNVNKDCSLGVRQ